MSRLRGSPPGSSSTSTLCSLYKDKMMGRTAHVGSSSFLNEYSCSIFLRVSSAGRNETGASRRTDGAPACFEWPRYRMNSSSLRRGSSAYPESSTLFVLHQNTSLMLGMAAAMCMETD